MTQRIDEQPMVFGRAFLLAEQDCQALLALLQFFQAGSRLVLTPPAAQRGG